MARKYTGGAEFNAGATADMDYDSTSGSTITYDTSTVHHGGFSWKFVGAASAPFLTRQYNSGNHDSYVRAYLQVTSLTTASAISVLLIRDATNGNNIDIRLTRVDASTFTLKATNEQSASAQIGNTSPNLSTNQWYRLEFSYVFSTGAVNVYIDGTLFATGTATASKASDTLRWGSIDSSTMTVFFDDIAVNDETTGGNQTGLPGPGHIVRVKPNGAGEVNTFATQTGGTAGSANNFTRVNEVLPDDATSFNGSSTLNQEDLFVCADPAISLLDTVNVVEVWGRFRNSTADATGSFKFEIEKVNAGTKSQSAAIIPNSTTWKMNATAVPKTPPIVLYKDPDNNNWTETTLATMRVGYIDTANPGTAGLRCDITSVSVLVDFNPAVIARDISNLNNTTGAQVNQSVNRAGNY